MQKYNIIRKITIMQYNYAEIMPKKYFKKKIISNNLYNCLIVNMILRRQNNKDSP
jgi:hypothetical protein